MLADAAGDRMVVVSLLTMSTAGLLAAAVNLLVPLQLHANGVSTASIGAAFGVAAAVFIVCSAAVARAADRAVKVSVVVVAMSVVIVATLIPLASESTPALFGFLLARAPLTAVMFTIAFPLGAIGARRAGITVGAVAALINIFWSLSLLLGPVLFAVVAEQAGVRAAYVVLMAVFACAIAWLVVPGRRARASSRVSRA